MVVRRSPGLWAKLGTALAISVNIISIQAFDWIQQPGNVRACNRGDAQFPWKYDVKIYPAVTMIYWKYAGTGDTVIAHHYTPIEEVRHYFDRYKKRTFIMQDANAGFLMKNVTKADEGKYLVELSGYLDGIGEASLKVYTEAELKPDLRVDNREIEPRSSIDVEQGKAITLTIDTDLTGNLVIDVGGHVTSCLNETLCSATLNVNPETANVTNVRFLVNYHICNTFNEYVNIIKTIPPVIISEETTTGAGFAPVDTSGATTTAISLVVVLILVVIIILIVLCVLWRRRRTRRQELSDCQLSYIQCVDRCFPKSPTEGNGMLLHDKPVEGDKQGQRDGEGATDSVSEPTGADQGHSDTSSEPSNDDGVPSERVDPHLEAAAEITEPAKPTEDPTPLTVQPSAPVADKKPDKKSPPPSPKLASSGDKTYDCGQLTLEVKQGDLTQQKVDAIVNSTVDTLPFEGAVAMSILRNGGETIRQECRELVREKGPIDTVAMTGSGKLPCKKIIHLDTRSAGTWGKKILDILDLAKSEGLTSVALPAFGTGSINRIPADQMAPAMFKGVREFASSDIGSIKYVSIVVYDSLTRDDFVRHIDDARRHVAPPTGPSPAAGESPQKPVGHPTPVSKDIMDNRTDGEPKEKLSDFPLNNVIFRLKKGDLTMWPCDVIVNGTNSSYSFVGAVSSSILKNGGYHIETLCQTLYDSHGPLNKVAYTESGRLPCKGIIHIDTQDERSWKDRVYDALVCAHHRKLTTVAFPAFGTGQLNYIPPEVMAPDMYSGVRIFSEKNPQSSVKEVTTVVYTQDDLDDFVAETTKTHLSQGPLEVKGEAPVQDALAKKGEAPIQDTQDGKEKSLPGTEQSPEVSGDSTDGATVDDAAEDQPLLQEKKDEEKKEYTGKWSYESARGTVDYPTERSQQIEAAFHRKDASFSWQDGLKPLTINFSDMEEVDAVTGAKVKVVRV